MRGSTELIRDRQRPYVDDFRDAAPVLDVGCGRGEFLGAAARGGRRGARRRHRRRTWSRTAAARASTSSRPTRSRTSRRSTDGSLGGDLRRAGRRAPAAARARPPARARAREAAAGGVLVAETINPLSPSRCATTSPTSRTPSRSSPRRSRCSRARPASPRSRCASSTSRRSRASSGDPTMAAIAERDVFAPLDYAHRRAHHEDRWSAAAGAVRARRRRDPRRAPRRGAARARPRGRARDGAVQVVSRRARCSPRRSSGACSTSRRWTGRPIDLVIGTKFPSLRSCAIRTRSSGSCTSSARPTSSTAPSSASSASSRSTARRDARCTGSTGVDARRGAQAVRDLAERRRPARALDRARGRGAAAAAAGARLPLRRVRRLRALRGSARPCEAGRPAAGGGGGRPSLRVVIAGEGPDRQRLEELAGEHGLDGRVDVRRPGRRGGARRPVRALPAPSSTRRSTRTSAWFPTRRSWPRSRS